ncbi:MAG: DUF4832 domain-containing protein [Saprospiraceae bacterium]|nr:DUF4832 domain-containing protein [Saprospiraceae bacterium]
MKYRIIFALLLVNFICNRTATAQMPTHFTNHGPGGGGYTYVPSISPHNANEVYLNCDMGGVYRSTDGAQTWQMLHYQEMVSQVKGKVQFTSDPSVLYVCRRSTTNLTDPWWRGELAKSTDGGTSWQPLPDPTATGVHRLEVDPNSTQRLLLNEYDRLFFSNDGGANWTQVYVPPSGNMWLGGVFWDGQNIYVGTNEGLLVSKDNGTSFNIENHSGLPAGTGIYHLAGAKSGNTLQLFCLPVAADQLFAWGEPLSVRDQLQGIFRMNYSTSAAWTNSRGNIPNDVEIAWVDLAQGNTQTVWAAAAIANGEPLVYKSTNGGSNWTNTYLLDNNQNIQSGWTGHEGAFWLYFNDTALGLDVAPTDPDRVIIADGTGHITTDGGATWRATYVLPASQNAVGQPSSINQFYKTSGLDVTTAHHIYWKNEQEIFVSNTDIGQTYSNDGGETWTFAHNLFQPWGVVSDNNWYLILRQPTTGHLFAAVSEINDMYLSYRITDDVLDGVGGLVAKSMDDGLTWDTTYNFGHPVVWMEVDKVNPSKLYASVVHSTEGGVFQSTNGGGTWTKLPNPPRTQGHPYNLVSLEDGSLVTTYSARAEPDGVTLNESSGVFLLPPGGNAWLDRTANAMKFYTKDLVVDPHDPAQNTWYATVWGRFTTFAGPNNQGNGGLYRTTDRGQTWTRVFANESAESITIHPTKPGTAYLTAENDGLFFTENLGASPNFERVDAFPFWRPKRVFFPPNNPDETWVTTMGGGVWKSKAIVPGQVDYTASTEDFPNPERGFYRYTETTSSNYNPLDANELQSWRSLQQPFGANYSIYSTLAFRYFVLEDFKGGPISQTYLNAVAQDFATARQAGVKLIPRFVYTVSGEVCGDTYCSPYGDAPKSVVMQHITQLKPILQANADVIATLQLGFIGIWGEGYYTDFFGDASQAPFGLTAQNWADRNEIIAALLDALPIDRALQVRYPQQKQKTVYGVNAPVTSAALTPAEAFQNTAKARIGHHNDCFLSSENDIGTYENYDAGANGFDTLNLKPYMALDSRFVPVGGETCADFNPYSNCNGQPGGGAQAEMERMHWSYLNADYNNALNNDWVGGGCIDEIKQRLGYRLELQAGEYPTEAQPGQSISIKIDLKNKGFAAPFNARLLRLLLRNAVTGAIWQVQLPDDPRRWLAGEATYSIEHAFCLPPDLPHGNYELLLHLADPYPTLTARPEYAIRLANEGVWEAATGYNKLLHQFMVNGTAGNAACNGETCFQPENASAPTTDFTANVQSGCGPLTVQFATQNAPCLSYNWSFPGGAPVTSTLANPTVVYQNPGNFPVTLTVGNAVGTTTKTEADFIQVQSSPVPVFDFSVNDLIVYFTSQTQNATFLDWDFGDSGGGNSDTSDPANALHIFSAPGTYDVTLYASNACGNQTLTQTVMVDCAPISVEITPLGPISICEGQAVQLNASSGIAYYQWRRNGQVIQGADSSVYSASTSGDYVVHATNTPNCGVVSDPVTVSISPTPIPSFNYSANNLTVSFANTSQNATSFLWDFGNGATSTETNPTAGFVSSGSYFVQLIATNECSADTSLQLVQVACVPSQVSISANAPTQFCQGSEVILGVDGSAFAIYQWYLDGMPVAFSNSSNIVVYNPGIYSIYAADLNNCGSFSNEITVEVWPLPDPAITVSPDSLVCEGGTVSLIGSGGNSFIWGLPGGSFMYEQTIVFTNFYPSQSGPYNLLVFDENGCYAYTSTILQAVPLPQVTLSGLAANYTNQDPPVAMIGVPTGGIFTGPGVTGGQFDPTSAGVGQHWIFYSFTDLQGCTGMDSVQVSVLPFVAASQLEGVTSMQILPNPTAGEFWLEMQLLQSKTLKIRLLNLLGQVVESRAGSFPVGASTIHFEDNGLPSGVYLIELTSDEVKAFLRLVVE